jgi:hypothetical protein
MALAEYFRVLAHIAVGGVNLIASLTDATPFGLIVGSGAPSGAYGLKGTRGLYFREDGAAATLIYYTVNSGTNWTALVGAGTTDFGNTGIKADLVDESTGGAGVTVDGLLIKDGCVGSTGAEATACYLGTAAPLTFGAGQEDSCIHDGTDTIWTHSKGNWIFDNTDVNDPTAFRLGTDTSATGFEVRNNSDAVIFKVAGDGIATSAEGCVRPAAITDPGNAGAIPITKSGVCVLNIPAGAETRTMAAPTFLGQEIVLCAGTDGGGTVEVTVATDFNAANNTKVTFGALEQTNVFKASMTGASLKWKLVSVVAEGGALS